MTKISDLANGLAEDVAAYAPGVKFSNVSWEGIVVKLLCNLRVPNETMVQKGVIASKITPFYQHSDMVVAIFQRMIDAMSHEWITGNPDAAYKSVVPEALSQPSVEKILTEKHRLYSKKMARLGEEDTLSRTRAEMYEHTVGAIERIAQDLNINLISAPEAGMGNDDGDVIPSTGISVKIKQSDKDPMVRITPRSISQSSPPTTDDQL